MKKAATNPESSGNHLQARVHAGTDQLWKTELLVLIVILIWASNFPVAKWGLRAIDPLIFNALRYLVATALLVLIYFSRAPWTPVQRRDWPKIIGVGFLANVVYQMAFIFGLHLTTAGNSAVLLSTAPLWTVFISARLHKERIRPMMWAGMAVSFCGVVMIIIGSGKKLELGSTALFGDLITLTAAFLWGLNTNLQKPLLTRYSPLHLTLIMISVGAVGLTLTAIPATASFTWGSVDWTYYAAVVVSGALSIAIANVLWSVGVKRLGPSRTANFGNLVPVLAFVASFLVLKEDILLIQVVGAAVTISGVWLARR
jgi:drug/metabolite transporter (DMT)-like permease